MDARISRIIIHPKWDTNRINNDVALIKLTKPVKLSNYKKICLAPNGTNVEGQTCIATGWGLTKHSK